MAKATNSPHGDLSTVRIGVVGHGVVGSAFTALVARQRDVIAARTGVLLDVVRIAVSDAGKHPSQVGGADVVTDGWLAIALGPAATAPPATVLAPGRSLLRK